MEPLTGEDPGEIAGYRLRARLGAGGMGRVYLALTPGGRPVALKVVRPDLGDDPDFRGRFRQEVAAARRVHGLYTAQVLDADPDGSPPWLVTAYVAGPSLQQAVAENGPLPAGTVLLLMAGVAEALQAIHAAGVVHRDLKPSNVLLASDGPRVIDFGIARAAEATAVTATGIRIGTPQFMAPEQVAGEQVSPATDVFALGALAAYAALGRPAFGEGGEAVMYRIRYEPPAIDGIPTSVRDLVERCLVKDPAQRPRPGDIIAACHAHTSATPAGDIGTWLPPVVAAGLQRHAPPPAHDYADYPPTATVNVPELPVADAGQQQSAGTQPTKPGGRRVPRAAIAGTAAAAVALAAALTAALTAALLPGGGGTAARHGTRQTSAASRSTTASLAATASSPVRSPTAKPTNSPVRIPALDSCVIGTWSVVTQRVVEKIGGKPVWFTGHGGTVIFRPDGTSVSSYGTNGVVYAPAGPIDGDTWSILARGQSSTHFVTRNGLLVPSHAAANGTLTVYVNGVLNQRDKLSANTTPDHYTCSGNTLQATSTNGLDSINLTRQP